MGTKAKYLEDECIVWVERSRNFGFDKGRLKSGLVKQRTGGRGHKFRRGERASDSRKEGMGAMKFMVREFDGRGGRQRI